MRRDRCDHKTRGRQPEPSRRQFLLRIGAAIAAVTIAGKSLQRNALATLCGGFDDSQDVELYDGTLGVTQEFVAAHQASVGTLRWNGDLGKRYDNPGNVNARRWCSGTLITDELFLTAGHCLENRPLGWEVPRINGTEQPISRAEVAANMNVEFDFQIDAEGNDRTPQSFAVVEVVEDRLGDLDYAILRLDGAPGPTFGNARIATENPPVGTVICIIGHPGGGPKRIDAGPVSAYQDIRIFYDDVDTTGGSAGSGILSSPAGALVGVHTNGGCSAESIGANYGVSTSGLLQVSPILQDLATA